MSDRREDETKRLEAEWEAKKGKLKKARQAHLKRFKKFGVSEENLPDYLLGRVPNSDLSPLHDAIKEAAEEYQLSNCISRLAVAALVTGEKEFYRAIELLAEYGLAGNFIEDRLRLLYIKRFGRPLQEQNLRKEVLDLMELEGMSKARALEHVVAKHGVAGAGTFDATVRRVRRIVDNPSVREAQRGNLHEHMRHLNEQGMEKNEALLRAVEQDIEQHSEYGIFGWSPTCDDAYDEDENVVGSQIEMAFETVSRLNADAKKSKNAKKPIEL